MRLFVDNLTNIDFSYLCPKRGLVGETWLANVELAGELDEQGMICDFGIVKKILRNWLEHRIDHCLLVPANSPEVKTDTQGNQQLASLQFDNSSIEVSAPTEAITLIDVAEVTPESVADWCAAQMKKEFGSTVAQVKLSFTTEHIESPYYHYSHGLKKHGGDCQRIAHGHRSKLLIWRNDALCMDAIQRWASSWKDIYIATEEDLIANDGKSYTFEYTSSQGFFRLKLPKTSCYMIKTDSTVEFIAQHLANETARHYPGDRIRVKAFEGIGKGAIAEALNH
ncbi:hypothetical protein DWB84_00010 [Saccharophagus sp. K07]|jgi:6-pyruvoyl-tetrahydropterin synthase|uniref:6-carboxytetrahydropterin synthase n=1 Tax=Saccharophagus sp. K07 TaxID=2283636 RepID=UPI0016525D2E|nr:6-carboxytetrahydropterin synthase [Saccharophagus sp. K07]MBC6903857.1 hypothetical protein [Saccharophagus sp. K07]